MRMPDHIILQEHHRCELGEARESLQRAGEARESPRPMHMKDHSVLQEHHRYELGEARDSEARESPPCSAEARGSPQCIAKARESPPRME